MTRAGVALAGTPETLPPDDQMIASAMSAIEPPHLPSTRTGCTLALNATPATPLLLFAIAATVPATRTSYGGKFYNSLFRPSADSGYWEGELFSWTITEAGEILDDAGQCAFTGDPVPPLNFWYAPVAGMLAWPWVFLLFDDLRARLRAREA